MRKLLVALGCVVLGLLMTGSAYGDQISFTFLGVHTTPSVSITRAGGVNLSQAPLLSINDSDTNNVFIVPGYVFVDTGPASSWSAAGGLLMAQFNAGPGIEVEVDSPDCVGGPVPMNGICLQGVLNMNGTYVAFDHSTGSFQGVFTVTYVSPWVPGLFNDPVHWLPQGSDSFTTGYNLFVNGGLTDAAVLGQGGVTFETVPEPGTLMLLGTGVLGLAKALRRK